MMTVIKGVGAIIALAFLTVLFVAVFGVASVIWPVVAPLLILWWALSGRFD